MTERDSDTIDRPRTALVTGSARRVGRAIAAALIADGWHVLVHARDAGAAERAALELGAFASAGADLADVAGVTHLTEAARAAFAGRGLDLLVNSASSFEQHAEWGDGGADGWARAFDVNARAPYLLTAALTDLLGAALGCVVNVSDRAAHEHWTSHPLHAASKAALESLTISGAKALARAGVRVNAVVPGNILPPESWSRERIERVAAAGELSSLAALVDAIRELVADASRTGEIVHL
ncbi:MAG: hypothetical protein JWN72_2327 [Thermoleophilia bacterium]|nr:hypothetical protein [Thermoleophilia bacterium]